MHTHSRVPCMSPFDVFLYRKVFIDFKFMCLFRPLMYHLRIIITRRSFSPFLSLALFPSFRVDNMCYVSVCLSVHKTSTAITKTVKITYAPVINIEQTHGIMRLCHDINESDFK